MADCNENAITFCTQQKMNYFKRSNEIVEYYFNNMDFLKTLELKKDFIELHLPVRLNLSGTWTDALPYCIDNGGQVINMSVKVDGELPIYISLKKLDEPIIKFISDDSETVCSTSGIDDFNDEFNDFILHKAALKVLGFTSETVLKHGFCLETKVHGIKKGSGLGVSSLLLLGCITAFEKSMEKTICDAQKINMVFIAEQVMKTGGGWQDQICGLSYGFNNTTTAAGKFQRASVDKIPVSAEFKKLTDERMAVVYTGQRHYGRYVVYEIMSKYLEGNAKVCNALNGLKELNAPMETAIINEDIKEIAALLNRQFALLKELSENITNGQIDNLADECMKYAEGVCICGAGAGGYLMLVLKENVSVDDLAACLARKFSKDSEITVNHISLYIE